MKQSSQRIPPSMLEGAARPPIAGAATITRLRAESSINDAMHLDLVAATIRGIGAAVLRIWKSYQQARHARATYQALRQLDDRSLHDLGFARDEIRSVAAEMAGQAPYSRRLLRSTLYSPQSFLDTTFRD